MHKKLYRSSIDNIIGGVCGGLGEYFAVDSNIIRIIFVLFGIFGAGFVAYLVLWIILPIREGNNEQDNSKKEDSKKENVNAMEKDENNVYGFKENNSRNTSFLAFAFIFFGFILLINNLFLSISMHKLWPLIIIVIGFSMIINNRK